MLNRSGRHLVIQTAAERWTGQDDVILKYKWRNFSYEQIKTFKFAEKDL